MRQTPETLSGANVSAWRLRPNRWDFVAFPMILGLLAMAAVGFHQTLAPMSTLVAEPISLDPSRLPEYALRTTLRMLAAMIASLVFTLVYGTLAAKSRRAEKVLVPVLDILQSVPVLGFISFTVTFFLALFPGRVLGAELAAIFAIFTSQAWNMTFSFYQSLRTVPRDLDEVSKNFQLTAWQRFWKLDVPYSMPGLVWNMMMSMSGGWFFVVASEAITVGNHTFALPGIGAYLAQAIEVQNTGAIGWVIVTMVIVILLYDQLLFRPLVAWADKFRMETTGSQHQPHSWLLDLIRKTRLIHQLLVPAGWVLATVARLPVKLPLPARLAAWLGSGRETTAALGRGLERGLGRRLGRRRHLRLSTRAVDILLAAVLLGMTVYFGWRVIHYMSATVSVRDVLHVFGLGLITLLRVSVLMLLASLVWVPIGILVGLRPALAEKVQ
ncbi:MAG: ABC transporter permease, partial [Janthinobacterium lividum]